MCQIHSAIWVDPKCWGPSQEKKSSSSPRGKIIAFHIIEFQNVGFGILRIEDILFKIYSQADRVKNRTSGLWFFGASWNLSISHQPTAFLISLLPQLFFYSSKMLLQRRKKNSYVLLIFGILLFLGMKQLEEQTLWMYLIYQAY